MALSIGVSSGSTIKVGKSLVRVKQILNPTTFVLSVDGKDVTISDKERTEILKNVWVFAGVGGGGVGNRLAFEAPRVIEIHRVEGANASKVQQGG